MKDKDTTVLSAILLLFLQMAVSLVIGLSIGAIISIGLVAAVGR